MFVSNSTGGRGYTIANSLRLRSSASAYLSRTHTAADRRMWTLSLWVKRGALGNQVIFACGVSTDYSLVRFNSSDQIEVADVQASATQYSAVTTAVFRDPSAWYHIVVAMDTAQGTAANRLKVFVNGTQYAVGSTPPLNFQSVFNAATTHYFSGLPGVAGYGDMYHAESIFVNAQALTPSSFGQTDTNGVWVPKAYSGTYGTNGFYLKFNDGSSTTNLCLDRSGNGNNWTPTNVSLTAGATYDWMVDTPTQNYCTLSPLNQAASTNLSAANLKFTSQAANWNSSTGSIGISSGKWYWEVTIGTTNANGTQIGVCEAGRVFIGGGTYPGQGTTGYSYYSANGQKFNNGAGVAYGATYTNNDVIGVALDMDAGTLTFYKNNTTQGQAFSGITGTMVPAIGIYDTGNNSDANFGQRPFTYTPPSGFKALCTANLTSDTITTSGSFTGNLNADGPFVWLNGNPVSMTINGNAVTFGTHADKTAGGFKVRSSSASYNNTGSNTYSITSSGKSFRRPNNAQGNP